MEKYVKLTLIKKENGMTILTSKQTSAQRML